MQLNMKISTGIDIIEVERIKKAIEELGDTFLNKIYTEKEIQYCNRSEKVKYQHFAARFAVKEAVFKALSNYLDNSYNDIWKYVEVINQESGKPYINVNKLNEKLGKTGVRYILTDIDISISHIKELAVANVVAVLEEGM